MYNDFNKSLKSAKASQFHLKKITKQYNTPQSNDYHEIYISESPTYYNKYRYDADVRSQYMNQMSNNNRQRKQIEYIEPKEKYDNSQRNPKPKISYYFNSYNSVKNSDEGEKVLVKRAANNLRNPSPKGISGKYYKIENNIKRSVGHSNDIKNMNNLNKEYDHQSYQEEKYAPKFYRNNPLIRTASYQRKINLEKAQNPLKPVAQKICNIIIKGEAKKNKDKKIAKLMNTEKKMEKNPNFINDIKIEGNVAQGSAIPYQNHKFNTNIKNPNNRKYQAQFADKYNQEETNEDNIDESENEEIEEKEEGIQVSSTKNEDTINSEQKNFRKERYQEDGDDEENNEEEYEEEEENNDEENTKENERDKVAEEQRTIEGIEGEGEGEKEGEEEIEKDVEEEGEMGEVDDENTKTHEKERDGEEFTQEQVEEDENYEEKEESIVQKHEGNNNGDNKEELEEYEEEEQQQIEFRKSNNKRPKRNIELKLQKESEVNLVGNKNALKPIMEIQKVHIIQHQNDKGSIQKKNNKLDIINDDNIEIIGHKKPLILEINEESNIQLMKQVHNPIIEMQKVDGFEQIRNNKDKLKNYIFNITKNKENDVDIIPEEDESEQKLEVEKVQDFYQPRNNNRKLNKKENKKDNKKIKLKIVKFKDGNFTLDKIEEEPEFEIQNVESFEQPRNKSKKLTNKKNKNKNIKFKIVKPKDIVEIIGNNTISICNENSFELKRKYENKNKNKKTSYKKLKQSGRNSYQYKSKQVINDAIIVPKDTRFILKAKYKPKTKKGRNLIKREITYFYKSQNARKNEELSIGGNIKNTIYPTVPTATNKNSSNDNNNNNNEVLKNQTKIISINQSNSRKKLISSSNTNSKKNINLNTNSNSDINTSAKKEGKNSYRTTTILSSNLVQSQSSKQETSSIRRNYLNKEKNEGISNKMPSPMARNNSSSKSSTEIFKTEGTVSYNRRNHLINNISPSRENEDNNKNRNQVMTNSNSKNPLLKSEDMNSGKTQTFIMNKINSRKEIPLPKDTMKNKSHTITIISTEKKSMGRTYISSNKMDQRPQSIEAKKEERNYSNNGIVFINDKKNNNSNKSESKNLINNRSQVYISSRSLRNKDKDKNEGTKSENNEPKEITHNTIYYSSSTTKKENKPFIDNNQMYISDNSSKNSNKVQTNINRIVVNSYDNSPKLLKNSEGKSTKDIEPNNIDKIITNSDTNTNTNLVDKPDQKNNTITESIKTTTITKTVENNEKKDVIKEEVITTTKTIVENNKKENQNELLTSSSNNLNNEDKANNDNNNNNEDIKEENILEKYNLSGNELSDITKSYLNSYMSTTRPELSDFSKQFLSSNVTENSGTRPELSNITRAYLFSQTPIDDDN